VVGACFSRAGERNCVVEQCGDAVVTGEGVAGTGKVGAMAAGMVQDVVHAFGLL